MPAQMSREEVPAELTWNLADIYPAVEDWKADGERLELEIANLAMYRGRLGEGAATLLAFLQSRDILLERWGKVSAYGQLHEAADGLAPRSQELAAQVTLLAARVNAALAFFAPEILALPEGLVEANLAAEPALAPYRRQLEDLLLRRPHVLSPETENALAALGEVLNAPGTIHQRVTATIQFTPARDRLGTEVPVSVAGYLFGLSQSPDRDLRRQAYESLTNGFDRHKVALATTLATSIQRNVTLARLRRYPSAFEMFLAPQRVPLAVYHNVIDVMHDEIAPHVRHLLQVRQRVLGLDQLELYDIAAPLDPGYDPPTTYAEGTQLIRAALAPLGAEYREILDAAFRDRWLDRAANVGRAAIPFCAPVYGVHPYVLTSWDDRLSNAFVLAHELGHAGHMALSDRHQIVSNAFTEYTAESLLLFAEVPSRVNEMLLGRYLLDTATDERLRRWVLFHILDGFLFSLRLTTLGAHLERRLYNLAEADRPVTLATIMQEQGEVLERFFGGTITVDDRARLNWMFLVHLYATTYVFTYPAGMACAYAVVDNLQRDGTAAVESWIAALKAGATFPPLELMSLLGVDLASPEPIRRFAAFFGQMVDEVERSFA